MIAIEFEYIKTNGFSKYKYYIKGDKRKLDAIHLFVDIYRALMIFTDTASEMTMSHC